MFLIQLGARLILKRTVISKKSGLQFSLKQYSTNVQHARTSLETKIFPIYPEIKTKIIKIWRGYCVTFIQKCYEI